MDYDIRRPLEKDWKLFRKKLPGWQENYMDRMNKEYKEILTQDKNPADIFWELEERISQDRKKTGVLARDIRRSNMWRHLLDLLGEDAITFDDLSEFSEELRDILEHIVRTSS